MVHEAGSCGGMINRVVENGSHDSTIKAINSREFNTGVTVSDVRRAQKSGDVTGHFGTLQSQSEMFGEPSFLDDEAGYSACCHCGRWSPVLYCRCE